MTPGWGSSVPEPLVTARGFGYRYPEGGAESVRDVDLELPEGGFTVLAGLSGSGKSTLLRAMCGLVPHFHGGRVRGELEVAGMSVRDHGPAELAAVCGTVFQDPETQTVMGGVRAEIGLALEHRGQPAGAVARAVEEVALAVGVGHLLNRRVETLSGGELQRVAIAAALVGRPRLVVLDEPTSQLDPVAGDELIWLLRRLNEEWGTAVVVAEHRLERCLPAADRVVALDPGEVGFDAAPTAFLEWDLARGGSLSTPLARLFGQAGLGPSADVGQAGRATGARGGRMEGSGATGPAARPGRRADWRRRRGESGHAVRARGVWLEVERGPGHPDRGGPRGAAGRSRRR